MNEHYSALWSGIGGPEGLNENVPDGLKETKVMNKYILKLLFYDHERPHGLVVQRVTRNDKIPRSIRGVGTQIYDRYSTPGTPRG